MTLVNNTFRLNKTFSYFIVASFLSIGFFGYLMHVLDWFNALPGDLIDTRFNSVVLEHLFKYSKGQEASFWSPTFFYPFEDVLAFSDTNIGSVLGYIPFRAIGFSREYSYAGWFVVGSVLNYAAALYVLKRLRFSLIAAAAGAFVFTFGLPVLLHQEMHGQLTYRFAIPFAFLALYEMWFCKRPQALVLCILWCAIQFLCSIYLGIFLVYLLIATFFGILIVDGKSHFGDFAQAVKQIPRSRIALAVIMIVVLLLSVALYLLKYRLVSAHYNFGRSSTEIINNLPRLGSYLLNERSVFTSWIGDWIKDIPIRHEQQLFVGVGVAFFSIVGVIFGFKQQNYKKIGLISLITIICLLFFTVNINGYAIYQFFSETPGINSVRAVSRIILVMVWPFSILVAIGFECFLQRRVSAVWIIVMMSILVVETCFYLPYNSKMIVWDSRRENVIQQLGQKPTGQSVLFVTRKKNESGILAEVDGMIFSQDLGLPTLNGYSGNNPSGYIDPDPCVGFDGRLNSFAQLRPSSKINIQNIERQTITAALTPCSELISEDLTSSPDGDWGKNITLVLNGAIKGDQLNAEVSIINLSSIVFNSKAPKGPIRLSWRFVPQALITESINAPGWDTRKSIEFSLKPSETFVDQLHIDLPRKNGRYQFEVTLVQEGIAWFQDRGMKIASLMIDIKEDQSASIGDK